MTIFRLDDLITPMTRAEVQASIYQALQVVGVNTTSWKSGAVVRTMIAGVSIMFSAYSNLVAQVTRSGFLELATGDWLTLVAYHVYGVERQAATFASGELFISNEGAGVYVFDAEDLIVQQPAGDGPGAGRTYRNTAPFSLGAGQVLSIGIRATEAGAASSANPYSITELTTPLLNILCTNPSALVGADEQSDSDLRRECTELLGARSPMGPWDAYSSAVRNATRPDGSTLAITRTRSVPDGYGNVYIYCATDGGGVPGDPLDPLTDIGIAQQACEHWAEPLAVTSHALSATPVSVDITYELWMYNTSGVTEADVATRILDRLRGFFSIQPVGGNVAVEGEPGRIYLDAISAVIEREFRETFHVAVSVPAADVVLTVSQVAVMGLVTPLGVHQVPPPQGFGGGSLT